MSRPYWSGPGNRGGNTYADGPRGSHDTGAADSLRTGGVEDYDTFDDDPDGDFDDGYIHHDNRWRWIAGFAAVVLFVSVVAIATVLSNDSATSTSSTQTSEPVVQDAAPPLSTTPRTVIATTPPAPPSATDLPPETVVTVTTAPSATHPSPEPPPPLAEAPPPDRTITYTVTGSRQLFDLVSIIYTDEQGFPRTDINVALPWSRTIVLNPGVETKSVTATSVAGQLNCSITDGAGATLLAQGNNSMIATCTQ
jgi:hypothetical protein